MAILSPGLAPRAISARAMLFVAFVASPQVMTRSPWMKASSSGGTASATASRMSPKFQPFILLSYLQPRARRFLIVVQAYLSNPRQAVKPLRRVWRLCATAPYRGREARVGGRGVDFKDIIYAVDGPIGVITLNRPAYRNAQGYRMLDEIDQAFRLARIDEDVRVVVVRGAGGVFSTGHDLGTPEGVEYRRALGAKP